MTTSENPGHRAITIWLIVLAALVALIVLWGGYTRLSESGLSMVNWHPIMGAWPPTSDSGWNAAFEAYKQYPEYQKVNRGMALEEFKFIFWIEYIHRMLGRFIGLVFVAPFVFFWWRGWLDKREKLKYGALLLAGAAQGLMGWYMVKSGLIDQPDVSQYRLAAHLGLATAIFGYLLWLIFQRMEHIDTSPISARVINARRVGFALCGLIFLQILAGALVAGLKAGHTYNSWPSFEGALIPHNLYDPALSVWANLFENPLTVQYNHRMLGYLVALCVVAFWLWLRKTHLPKRAAIGLRLLPWFVFAQLLLGILTLVLIVPTSLALAHQAGALALLGLMIFTTHELSMRRPI